MLNSLLGIVTTMLRLSSNTHALKSVSRFTLPYLNKRSLSRNLPEEADVVIIGGGNVGINTLYQLTNRGVNAVLLEKHKLTSGTTWHSNGLFWRLRPSDVDIQLLSCLPKLAEQLEKDIGLSTGLEINGGLFIARTNERLNEYKRLHTIGKYFGLESEIISSAKASKLHPLLDPNSFTAALYSPNDGRIDPSMYCAAVARAATSQGGQILENCEVLGILTDSNTGFKKIKGVQTELGTIKTSCLVNAAGVWSANIAKMVGLVIPLTAFKHGYIITDSVPKLTRSPNVRDHDASVCYKTLGNTFYIGGYEINPVPIDKVPNDFAFGLYDLDLELFSEHVEKANELTPALRTVGLKNNVYGPEAFTPDHRPLLGEDPRLSGFYHASGFNSSGIMLGAGCAEQLAIWIINGHPELQMANYDIRRFTPLLYAHEAYTRETSHESYATNYGIVHPNFQPLAARNLITEPIHESLVASGAVMEQVQGWERPGYFLKSGTAPVLKYDWYGCYNHPKNEDKRYVEQMQTNGTFDFPKTMSLIADECRAARENVALFSHSYFGKFYLTGEDAEAAAGWLFTSKMNAETFVQSCTLNSGGRIEGYVNVLKLDENSKDLLHDSIKRTLYYVTVEGSATSRVLHHMNTEIKNRNLKVNVLDATEKMGILSVQGPKSEHLIETVVDEVSTCKNFPQGASKLVKINGNKCRLVRLSHVGETGFELHVPNNVYPSIYDQISKIGKKFNMKLAGFKAFASLNIEKGGYICNSDITTEENPIEARLDHACNSRSYLGKNAVDAVKTKGPKKLRTIFTLDEPIALWGLEVVWRNNKIVGFIKRGDYGHCLKKSIGIGYVNCTDQFSVTEKYVYSGQYEIEVMGKRYPAKVYLDSPFDPEHRRL